MSRQGDWISLDIRKLVSQWFRHPRENLGIVIQAFDSENESATLNVDLDETSPQVFILIHQFVDVIKKREKNIII